MQRTVHFRQVEWFGHNENLLDLLRVSLGARPNVENTLMSVKDENCEVRHRSVLAHEVRLHLVTYVQGATKGVRPATNGVPAADVLEASPPANSEFVERELAIVARQHSLGYVATGHTFGSTVERALRALVAIHHGAPVGNRLMLPARADPEMIQSLLEQGVAKLDLELSLPGPDAEIAVDGQPRGLGSTIASSVWNGISTRFTEDHAEADIDSLANVTARLAISLGRKPALEQVDTLTELATTAINSGDEFSIRTTEGTSFTRDKLSLKGSYYQPNQATLGYQMAWGQISNFLDAQE